MNIELELIIRPNPDGRKFLNYWDVINGNDVCCQIIDGKLMKSEYDEVGNELSGREISLQEFVELIEKQRIGGLKNGTIIKKGI